MNPIDGGTGLNDSNEFEYPPNGAGVTLMLLFELPWRGRACSVSLNKWFGKALSSKKRCLIVTSICTIDL